MSLKTKASPIGFSVLQKRRTIFGQMREKIRIPDFREKNNNIEPT